MAEMDTVQASLLDAIESLSGRILGGNMNTSQLETCARAAKDLAEARAWVIDVNHASS